MATLRASKITRKGQVTIPIEIRKELDFKVGDTVLFEQRGKEIVMIHPEDVKDWTSGAFKAYAKGKYLTSAEMREIAEIAIAEQVMDDTE